MGWQLYDVSKNMPGGAVSDFVDKYNSRVGCNLNVRVINGLITCNESSSRVRMVERGGESYVLRERLFKGGDGFPPFEGMGGNEFSVGVYHPNDKGAAEKLGREIEGWFDEIEEEVKGRRE
jgi:hypothetical protein